MSTKSYNVEKKTRFSESLIWQFNRSFYQEKGISAWSDGVVPHEITNSALAATTYAEMIYAFLKDLELNGKTDSTVYILELGAGHGRLCFNILKHLDHLIALDNHCSTQYCYVLSDIAEDNLSFFSDHPKFQEYFDSGKLDISYFDATASTELKLRKSKKTISPSELDQPIMAVANYFFDSLPNELFYFQDGLTYDCSVSIDSDVDPNGIDTQELIDHIELTFHKSLTTEAIFENDLFNDILTQYSQLNSATYILFPKAGLECIANISSLSKSGLVLLTMDKGYKDIEELASRAKPDLVKHGSFSFWVNFHAISQYCLKRGGIPMLDTSTNMSIEFGCLFFMEQPFEYPLLEQKYRKHTSQLNLDDLSSLKKFVYKNLGNVDLTELLSLIRLSAYDATIFINLLPSIKHLAQNISLKQRIRLRQTINHVWSNYYVIKEEYDLSYELGGLLYDLGFYQEALGYFNSSEDRFGDKIDINYNQILCYFQLRQDQMFYKTLQEAKQRFPLSDAFNNLEKLDMN